MNSVVGLGVWLVAYVALPPSTPMEARILLLAPLVIVPRLLGLLPSRPWIGRLAGWPALVAALPLIVAFALPAGPVAVIFALPWLAIALIGTSSAIVHGLPRLPDLLRPSRASELGVDVALGFWSIGALFIAVDRLGLQTGFSPDIVLLTGVHFHFAGFGLLGLTSLLATDRPWLRASVFGLVVGIPVTAVGFVASSDAISAIGALIVGTAGIGIAVALVSTRVHGTARWAQRAAGVALLVGMPMGIAWSVSILFGPRFLDLDTMIATHGALNAMAVLLTVLSLGWSTPSTTLDSNIGSG